MLRRRNTLIKNTLNDNDLSESMSSEEEMEILLMDNYAQAFNSLNDLIHELYKSQPYKKPIFLSEIEHFRQIAIPIELGNIINEIRGNMSTSKLQHQSIFKMQ